MADDANNLVLHLLREIREEQSKQSGVIEAQSRSVSGRLDILQETLAYTRGLASHGQIRHDITERRLEDLEARVARLEQR
jgi:hypothetical protein